jgi:hypothetical protein
MLVEYQFEVEADSDSEADSLAGDYEYWDDQTAYYGVYSIEVEEDTRYVGDGDEEAGDE